MLMRISHSFMMVYLYQQIKKVSVYNIVLVNKVLMKLVLPNLCLKTGIVFKQVWGSQVWILHFIVYFSYPDLKE